MSYKNAYTEIRDRHQREFDKLDIRCALTDKSFREMFKAWNLPLTKDGCSQVYGLGNSCYIRKSDYPNFKEVTDRHEKEMKEFLDTDNGLEQAMIYQFHNYEAMYSEDSYDEALKSLYINPEKMTEREMRVYKSARKKFWDECVENEWF